ncbi:hypothetical protein [Robertkochia solimangrovi]|uniref:hypothetical protein n=1 Tax=Robertkochia solimangrovi TaxID=2213046 RepID=UPI00117F3025|nr:hypothetical protein [Robertkochia solimangrovi]
MKNLLSARWLLLIMLAPFVFSCTSESIDNDEETGETPETPETTKGSFLKNYSHLFEGEEIYRYEVEYDDDNRAILLKELYLDDNSSYETSIKYADGKISEMIDKEYEGTELMNEDNILVSYSEGMIELTGVSPVSSLKIYYEGIYIDSIRYTNQDEEYPADWYQIYKRNEEDQMIYYAWDDDYICTITDHDTSENLDAFGGGMEFDYNHFFSLFGLKVSKNNPIEVSTNYGNHFRNIYEYDENGNILSWNTDNDPEGDTAVYEYITIE